MKTQLIEIADGKFISSAKIVCLNIYQKEVNSPWRVGFEVDSSVKEQQRQFSKPFNTKEEARNWVNDLNSSLS